MSRKVLASDTCKHCKHPIALVEDKSWLGTSKNWCHSETGHDQGWKCMFCGYIGPGNYSFNPCPNCNAIYWGSDINHYAEP